METETKIGNNELMTMDLAIHREIARRCHVHLLAIWSSEECPKAWKDDYADSWIDIIDAHASNCAAEWRAAVMSDHDYIDGHRLNGIRGWIMSNAHRIIMAQQKVLED